MMLRVLDPVLDKWVVVYLDDLLIYSKTAFLITLGAILVIRKRSQRRRNNSSSTNSRRASFSYQAGHISSDSLSSTPNKRTLIGTWDQKTLAHLENGLLASATRDLTTKMGKEGLSMATDEIPPVSAYNNWERRGSIQDEVMSKTTTTTSGLMGITQTTIVSVPMVMTPTNTIYK